MTARSAAAAPGGDSARRPLRHSALVRVTHWIIAAGVFGLLASGVAILLAHPRLYWGETGAVGAPALLDLPLPFVFGQTGWARHLHFLAAWALVLAGLIYVLAGLASGHFTLHLLPSRRELTRAELSRVLADHLRGRRRERDFARYNAFQQAAYVAVVFALLPLMVWTGLAMSPAVTSVLPFLVEAWGGQQSARSVHFLVANLIVVFVLVHVALVCTAGAGRRLRAMITGRGPAEELP